MECDITINVKNFSEKTTVKKGTALSDLCAQFESRFTRPPLLATVDSEMHHLSRPLLYDSDVEFFDISEANGYRAYQRGVSFIMIYAVKTLLGKKARVVIKHSINKNYYCEIPGHNENITDDFLTQIEKIMTETVERRLPIEKISLQIEAARKISGDMGLEDKLGLLRYRRTSFVNFYRLDWFYNYFNGQMPPNTEHLGQFKLIKNSSGFILQFPAASHDFELAELSPNQKIFNVFEESSEWARILKVETVCSLNDQF
ncbi:MAG: hypothetical protein FWE82_05215, partial [Defluviitaleaceae bacterium]|nr:hypothetical protein [Defluviitaleaceae bacterium]